ncbi:MULTISPECIES: TetR family transcriptional regulator [Pseudomonadati]|uniref:TetR/AcrR family transcriptional regulator n=1 Tax=Shewanella aestuarii TaxID=1028752 RepID=A0ABT0KZ27_9GAMM|nr:TetR family transcriptional regulator [Shewanella aestuarii]MCL1116728.1 TetR/AcrR family transcriptional regulator [Shewanella aestuarii]GGN72921.1 TetR family transcriptional regulator [Shewanella aestuarii]
MAKRSRIETEQTVNQILDEALKQILTIGFDAMSYTTLSTATGISRTGISHHFPKKTEFLVRLDHRIGQLFVDALNFDSITSLESSWKQALQLTEHKAVLKLFFSLCGTNSDNVTYFKAMNSAQKLALLQLGEAGEKCVAQLIGHSAITLLENALPLEAA